MFSAFGTGSAAFDLARQELERMQQAYGAAFQLMLGLTPPRTTPAEELLREHGQGLLRYTGQRPPATLPTPVLLVPSPLNGTSLLDLGPNRSLVAHLLEQGFAVYGIDWRQPERLDRSLTLEFYAGFVRRALAEVLRETGGQQLSLLGYCLGGTLTAIAAALEPERVRNLVQLAAPVHFHDSGLLSQWLRFGIGDVDLTLDTLAALPPPLMRASLQMLKPTLQIAQQATLHSQLGDEGVVRDLLAMQAWLGDSMFYPVEAYRTIVKALYRQNALVRGLLQLEGRLVDLGAIRAALLIVTAAQDRICPPDSARALATIVAAQDMAELELAGGHLSLLAGRSATQTLWPQLDAWLVARSG
jgi:polyhydroxyalkanoate synthase subunit PhaC